jgi:hypothetical protein
LSFTETPSSPDAPLLSEAVANGAFGNTRGLSHQFSHATVENAARVIDNTDIARALTEWRVIDSQQKHPGGRPSKLNDRAVLVAILLLAIDGKALHLTRIGELFKYRLEPQSLRLLGLNENQDGSLYEWCGRAFRAFHRITALLDGYRTPRRSRLTREAFNLIESTRGGNDTATKQERLDWVSNQLLEATMQLLPRRVRRRWNGSISFDATLTQAFARGSSQSSQTCSIEPHAAWYVREGDHRDTQAGEGKKAPRKLYWGWETTIAVTAHTNKEFPYLAVAMTFDKPGHNVTPNTRTLVRSLITRGHPSGYAIADRAYFPNAKPEQLQLPMRDAGYKLVFDYRDDQLGIIDTYGGANLIEGNWYRPSMPRALVTATIDHRSKTHPISDDEYKQRIQQRSRYLLKPKAHPDSDGYQIFTCPAVGTYATVACDLKPASVRSHNAAGRTRIPVNALPEHPDRICSQQSVTFPPTAGAKYAQALQYKSPDWQTIYATNRNAMEGFNGYLKDPNRNTMSAPGLRRARGRAAQQLLVSFLIAAANIAKIRSWLKHNPNDAKEEAPATPQHRKPRRPKPDPGWNLKNPDPPPLPNKANELKN